MRESVERYGHKYNLSRGYAAFYRNKDFYTKIENLSDKNDMKFIDSFEGYEYFMYYTNKLFSIFPNAKNELMQNPMKIEYYAKNFKSEFETCRFYYVFKKEI